MLGVGYHHAGVDLSDRKLIEKAFTLTDLPVLCETLSLIQFYIVPYMKYDYIHVQDDLCFYCLCKPTYINRKDKCHRLQQMIHTVFQ